MKGGTLFSKRLASALAIAILAVACAAGQAFRKGEVAMKKGDLDAAVAAYRTAVQAAPENASFKIALQRAMLAASRAHIERAREYEKNDQLEAALGEYKQASEYDPSNRLVAVKVADLDRVIRERVDAARPASPPIQQARERARVLVHAGFAAAELHDCRCAAVRSSTNVPLRDILGFIGTSTGINITYDRQYQDRSYTIQLDGVTLEQALKSDSWRQRRLSVMAGAERAVDSDLRIQRAKASAVRRPGHSDVFYLSNADATEMAQLLSQAFRPTGIAIQPAIAPNKAQNSITIRATAPVVGI